jgi:hypothetical protein
MERQDPDYHRCERLRLLVHLRYYSSSVLYHALPQTTTRREETTSRRQGNDI